MIPEKPAQMVVKLLWRCLAFITGFIPEKLALRIAFIIGSVICGYSGSLRRRVESDIKKAFASHGYDLKVGRVRRITRRTFLNMAMNLAEFLRFGKLDKVSINSKVTVHGLHHLEQVMEAGKGGIILTLHLGNWELQGAWYSLNGYPLNAIFINQYNRALGEEMNRLRKNVGIGLIPRSQLRRAVRLLQKGELVGVLADQDGGPRGDYCKFFNRVISAPPTPAWMAARAGCPLLPAYMIRESAGQHRLVFLPPLPPPGRSKNDRLALTRQVYKLFESLILANSEQWLWLYSRWKDRIHTDRYVAEKFQ